MLAQPVLMKANHWHVVSAKISGPSSDCGATGRRVVECDDVTFTFRNSAISNNGTDVNVGQIPELYYQYGTCIPSMSNKLAIYRLLEHSQDCFGMPLI
ncbi:unnamed protein product [Strongylus vulgaris]|uniref:PHR domain-containing protein n=1 Tax=Strongylus vulgaris TaxID=40348 RepID=A0A3P7LDP9_STRVU|nr:unnamed protein product [Strongylus vulgaris]